MLVAMLDMVASPRMQVLETNKLSGLLAKQAGRPQATTPLNHADGSADEEARSCLLQQRQHGRGLLVGLCQHGGGGLLDDLATCQLGGRLSVIGVLDAAA